MVRVIKKSLQSSTVKAEQTQKVLSKMSHHIEEEQAAKTARENNLSYVDLNIFPANGDDIRTISEEDALKYQIAVFQKTGKSVRMAVANPTSQEMLDFLAKLTKENGWEIHKFVASYSSLSKLWARYKGASLLENLDMMHMSLSGKDLEDFEKEFGDLLELKKRIREIPTTQVINTIMSGSIKMKASDVHFEPQEELVRLRYRIDGMLQDIGDFPPDVYRFIVSRIKMMSHMKINLRDIAQDGHFTITLENNSIQIIPGKVDKPGRIDIRVSIIPAKYGESIVMRLLNQSDVMLKVEDLGLRGLAYEQLMKQVEKPNGMILTTGPTGSGKTTTLYALINKLNAPDTKIITVEDPIEYEIVGISQTQVSKGRGYTFANGLRAIVRQDPDIILVGEIRDEETADISINAALTGHLVLSTIHTNNSAATIPRFIELGVKPNVMAPAINAIIAQRLVRKLCNECKEKYVPAKETIDSLKKILAIISPKAKVEIPKDIKELYRSKGCPKCHNLGYKGRLGIYEVLTITESVDKLIMENGGEEEIMQAALEDGIITMAQDGILKALEGITSMEEVWSVTGQAEFLENVYEKLMEQSLSRAIQVTEADLELVSKNIDSFPKLEKLINESNQKDVIRYVFGAGLLLQAGDIHIEPEEGEVLIRFRIDGILQTIAKIPINEYPTFLGEIKILSGFKTETRGGVKDSRFTIAIEKPYKNIKEIKTDVRVSIILGGYGETVVMRLLNKSAMALDINVLGIRKQNLDKILHEIQKPNGFFLNTGPTGSGKTTTLYSLLGIINKPEVKIITVEDPIEYQLHGILQTQVNAEANYTFPTALRALMRQNPDVIMIGEIRDNETANIAVQSALTGHFVFSTLHTNDAPGAIPRLINMGLRTDDLAVAASGFMAQRLVRKLCPECKEKVKLEGADKDTIEKLVKTVSPKSGVVVPPVEFVYKAKGCEKCNGIGYKGRTTVSEMLVIDRDIKELIAHNALSFEIREKAIQNGMITMQQDGYVKVLEGETTMEEVQRVTIE